MLNLSVKYVNVVVTCFFVNKFFYTLLSFYYFKFDLSYFSGLCRMVHRNKKKLSD
jgi:hypothetical protein